ncbi:MAG TPA: glycosyltransferase, partial [Roseiflexaceae bacterium]
MTGLAQSKNDTPPWIPTPTHVADVELTCAAAPLTIGSGYHAARLLVRVHGCPVGYADLIGNLAKPIDRARILAALDPAVSARVLHHLADDLVIGDVAGLPDGATLGTALDMAGNIPCVRNHCASSESFATVAVCTHDRAHSLGATLDSLLRQTYRNFEILVVDNAPSDETTACLVQIHYPEVRYVCEAQPGLDRARNRAIAEAHGEFIAYIDDDAIADSGWLSALIAAFDSPNVMCVTGLVVPTRLATPAQELFERFGFSMSFDQRRFNRQMQSPRPGFPFKGFTGTGCNSAFRRSVFDQVGLFDPCLDVGTPVPGGGDLDMFARIIRADYELIYDPAPVIFHDHIADMAKLIDKMGQYHKANIAYLTKHILSDRAYAPMILRYICRTYMRTTVRGLGAVLLRGDRPLAMVFNQAFNAWLGPFALYRSHRAAHLMRSWASRDAEPGSKRLTHATDLLWHLVLRDFSLRYKHSVLGILWSLLLPLAQLLVMVFLFQAVVPLHIEAYPAFVFCALLPWGWFTSCLSSSCGLFISNRDLIRHPNFAPANLMIVNTLSNLITFVVALPILGIVLAVYGRGMTAALLLLPLLMLLQGVLTAGLSFIIATLNVFYRDVQHIVTVALMLLFYLTPVFYRPQAVAEKYQLVYKLNPMAVLVQNY